MDVSGEQQLDIAHDIYKQRFDLAGNPISETKKESALPSSFEHLESILLTYNGLFRIDKKILKLSTFC